MLANERSPRSRLVAFLLSLLLLGSGHAYVGQTRRAVYAFGAGALVLVFTCALATALPGRWNLAALLIGVILAALIRFALVFDVLTLPQSRFVSHSGGRILLEALALAVLGIGISVATRAFLLEAFTIPGGSMMPTLAAGEHFYVDKFTYRFRDPKRGEVAVFAFPEHPEQDFVKRVIARGGDVIETKGGHPWINGWEVPHCVVGTVTFPGAVDGPLMEGELDLEFLGGRAFTTFYDRANGSAAFQEPFTVAPGEFFVLGDNRNNSYDSRMWFQGKGGGVRRDLFRGPPVVIWFSTEGSRIVWNRMGQSFDGPPSLPEAASALAPRFERCLSDAPPFERTVPPAALGSRN